MPKTMSVFGASTTPLGSLGVCAIASPEHNAFDASLSLADPPHASPSIPPQRVACASSDSF